MDFRRTDSLNFEFDPSDRNKVLELLAQRIAQLPRIPKIILAMYYYENLRPAEIATALGLTENDIELLRTQAVRLLRSQLATGLRDSDRLEEK